MSEETRYSFPYPTANSAQLRNSIVKLMSDGKRRSIREIQDALGTQREVGARIRELRTEEYGSYDFTDARSAGPDDDGVFRYQLRDSSRTDDAAVLLSTPMRDYLAAHESSDATNMIAVAQSMSARNLDFWRAWESGEWTRLKRGPHGIGFFDENGRRVEPSEYAKRDHWFIENYGLVKMPRTGESDPEDM